MASAQEHNGISDVDARLTELLDEYGQPDLMGGVKTMLRLFQTMPGLKYGDLYRTVETLICDLDKRLSEQINLILHHECFQRLESAWRGLYYLVSHTQNFDSVKIQVLNISKKELERTLKKYKGSTWDQSPIFKKIYEDTYGTPGGEPYGCLIGDYAFDQSPQDTELLRSMAKVVATAHCPFIAAASPAIMNLSSWQELANLRNPSNIFSTQEYLPWRNLRTLEDCRYIALTLPGFLGRVPYGIRNNLVEGFCFEENTGAGENRKHLWLNAAYALGVNINAAFFRYGWCANIRGMELGGVATGLPTCNFQTEQGDSAKKMPTETAITERCEAELSRNGFLALCHIKNSGKAFFCSGQTIYQPKTYSTPEATLNELFSSKLQYIFCVSRFAHNLKCMIRDKIGTYTNPRDLENYLNNWISEYVVGDVDATEEVKAKYPLTEAKIQVQEIEGKAGCLKAIFHLKPHYQLEGINASFHLVSTIYRKNN